jgi:hypothetical protein
MRQHAHKLVFLFCVLLLAGTVLGQQTEPDYKSRPLPSFGIRLIDDTYYNTRQINKGKPSVFVLFSPDCHHCTSIAKELTDSLAAFRQCNLFFISPPMPFDDIRKFAFTNGVAHQSGLKVGQDTAFFFGSFYHAGTVPFTVIYDRKKKWFNTLGAMHHVSEILSELRRMEALKR